MSEEQMRKRCPSATKLNVGFLPAYRLVFNRKGTYRDGGVASISPTGNATDRVYGIIWELSTVDVQKLDDIEDPKAYTRTTIRVTCIDGTEVDCSTYIAIPQADYVSPDPEYFDLLLATAEAADLPDEYIKTIKSFAVTEK